MNRRSLVRRTVRNGCDSSVLLALLGLAALLPALGGCKSTSAWPETIRVTVRTDPSAKYAEAWTAIPVIIMICDDAYPPPVIRSLEELDKWHTSGQEGQKDGLGKVNRIREFILRPFGTPQEESAELNTTGLVGENPRVIILTKLKASGEPADFISNQPLRGDQEHMEFVIGPDRVELR